MHESVSLTNFADYRRSTAALAQARAKAEIAVRGLVVTVTGGLLRVGRRATQVRQRAARVRRRPSRFLDISQKLENGGEVAHADVIKARIQSQQQQRDFAGSATWEWSGLGWISRCFLFPDFNQDFAVVDDLQTPEPMPAFQEIEAAGKKNNPDLRSALAAYEVANHEVTAAWGGLLPALSVDYFYGIDSNQFAIRTDGVRNLGYSGVATLADSDL